MTSSTLALLLATIAVVPCGCAGDDADDGADAGATSSADAAGTTAPGPTSADGTAADDGGDDGAPASSAADDAGPGGGDDAADTSDDAGPTIGPIRCRDAADGITTLTFVNGCDDTLSYRGSGIDGGELAPGEHACVDLGDAVAPIDAIRYWGFIGPDPGGEHHTLAELTLNTDFNDFDWYNISHVDAHNLPMQIVPFGMDDCRTLTCPDDLRPGCPEVGRYFIDDALVACVSPDRDNPDSPVAQYFEQGCADAYSWSGDDAESVATCTGEDFDIVFCP